MLEDAHFTSRFNADISIDLYEQIITNYNKLFINNYIFVNNKLNISYYYKDNIHIITSVDEYTKLTVTSSYLKIKSNINYPSFFNNIGSYSDNIFICDFINQDYFWLNKIIKKENNFIKQ